MGELEHLGLQLLRLKMNQRMLLFNVLVTLSAVSPALCNQYDPHVMPVKGPFFEGWYMRLIDHSKDLSLGVLFGSVVPEDKSKASKLNFVGLLRSTSDDGLLKDYNAFPEEVSVTVKDGRPVVENPDRASPVDFTWSYSGGFIRVTEEETLVNVTIDNVRFTALIGRPHPWGPNGIGPMNNWDNWLPFPLFWFVYSLRSPVTYYEWVEDGKRVVRGHSGIVHMEKNWGDSFPGGWIWIQGYGPTTNTTFALTYGPVDVVGPLSLNGFLFGYRNPAKGVELNFRPDNALVSRELNGCHGDAMFEFTSLTMQNRVKLVLSSGTESYSDCLYGPMHNGFRPVCRESFKAEARVEVYKKSWLSWELVDTATVNNAALEFGGKFTCNKECEVVEK